MNAADFSAFCPAPKRAEVIEVCPRDGFQNVKAFIPTATKIAILDDLAEAGFKTIEVTSFVSPKAIPQMADAAEVLTEFRRKHVGIEAVALVPNVKGAEKAIANGAHTLNFVLSASESHNRENTRRTVDESLTELAEVCHLTGASHVHASVATAFTCPFEGDVPKDAVIKLVDKIIALGCKGVSLADTIGTASPRKVYGTLRAVKERFPQARVVLHLHDTQGMALANIMTAMSLGYNIFDAAAGGLGGCPFAPGAAGNVATEDLLNFLTALGVETDVDAGKVLNAAMKLPKLTGVPLCSHMAALTMCKTGA